MPEQFSPEEIFNRSEISELLESFCEATGLSAAFYSPDADYTILPRVQPAFCQLIQSCPEGRRRCRECMCSAGAQALKLGEYYITRCHAGMVECYAPLVLADKYLGFVVCGPLSMWEWDETSERELEYALWGLDVNHEALTRAAKAVGIYTGRSVRASADLIFMMVKSLAGAGLQSLSQRRELSQQQAKIAELIFEKKQAEDTLTLIERRADGYPLKKERELAGSIRIGDSHEARSKLNEILGEIFFSHAGNLDVLKSRMMELLVIMHRAAAEGGSSISSRCAFDSATLSELSQITDFEELCRWVVRQLDLVMDSVYELRGVHNLQELEGALSFIRANYHRNISLEDVAAHVFISPFYLSHLFRDELGITYIDYLTRVRMEAARIQLSDTRNSIAAVAANVGYDDPGYFGKVFKKYWGVTPKQYRST